MLVLAASWRGLVASECALCSLIRRRHHGGFAGVVVVVMPVVMLLYRRGLDEPGPPGVDFLGFLRSDVRHLDLENVVEVLKFEIPAREKHEGRK
jgi:hypothetical protein